MNRTHSKPPMTEDEAIAIVAEMKRKTSIRSQISLIGHALGPIGNLGEAARQVYSARLADLGGGK